MQFIEINNTPHNHALKLYQLIDTILPTTLIKIEILYKHGNTSIWLGVLDNIPKSYFNYTVDIIKPQNNKLLIILSEEGVIIN